jgi:hypothetical protein
MGDLGRVKWLFHLEAELWASFVTLSQTQGTNKARNVRLLTEIQDNLN